MMQHVGPLLGNGLYTSNRGVHHVAVMSCNNRRNIASGVLCGSAPWLYDSIDRVLVVSELSSVEYSGVN
jgi:hypothetical protein